MPKTEKPLPPRKKVLTEGECRRLVGFLCDAHALLDREYDLRVSDAHDTKVKKFLAKLGVRYPRVPRKVAKKEK